MADTQAVTLTGKQIRSYVQQVITLKLTDIQRVSGDASVMHLALANGTSLGIITGSAYDSAAQVMGIQDLRYFINELNLDFVLNQTAANDSARQRIFQDAQKRQILIVEK
ncbi:hypothetical protein [Levilactobacillus enshiensis]|uniref:hypothetical protein n=1 Tax=Levilactobacillus enshiensis TaxID=2590213 RepID=UPI001179973F|nr:hypothetical protein [Levilactobacillus enshiensis]